jgi:hypothetical protein
MRLNAEHQAFTRTLKAINADDIKPEQDSAELQSLKTYLDESTTRILSLSAKTEKFAAGNDGLLTLVAAAAGEAISPGEAEALKQKLADLRVRKNIFRKVTEQSAPPDLTGIDRAHLPPRTINALFYFEGIHMGQKQSALLAFVFGVIFVTVLLVVNIAIPNPTATQWTTFRIILSLAAGGVGAMIPGILDLKMEAGPKFAIQAGGALAVFVIVYFFQPGLPPPIQ